VFVESLSVSIVFCCFVVFHRRWPSEWLCR
jgi:hypothetical protein